MLEIREITALETFPVRHPVLRNDKPLKSCAFDGDDLRSTKHFGLYENEELAGVISVFKVQNSAFANDMQFQIRGMAVLETFRKRGFGEQLVRHVETFVSEKSGKLIWFNARQNAVRFYKSLGYEVCGDSFDIPDVGIHLRMFKNMT